MRQSESTIKSQSEMVRAEDYLREVIDARGSIGVPRSSFHLA